MNKNEKNRECEQVVHVHKPEKQIVIRGAGMESGDINEKQFTYDEVYGIDST
jgi:hypothetical protein